MGGSSAGDLVWAAGRFDVQGVARVSTGDLVCGVRQAPNCSALRQAGYNLLWPQQWHRSVELQGEYKTDSGSDICKVSYLNPWI
ncbi:hypothetical protein CE456_00875 (plasmid) [Aeromonas salmonicida]|nr:hypothetical protein CE456_00875 [Aeromonas salmonicida]